ncbi:hypothetical protein NS226_08230 [Aureimonas ureilytica]|uniref:DUF736 domain-containing protein n=1 Tax=Aureimonas ureilytica TaxID=401562 RepID=A0A175R9U6_9HYPH|nr:DUF736 domain-containing protein [Aureimonas ureilytica]KTQ96344.1 hypothetical protein NS226_08230 [Aureimonas ureilytica]
MPLIGTFTRTPTGFAGRVRTLSFDTQFVIVALDPSASEHAPDYRIHVEAEDGPEVGAGWKRTGERAGDYVAVVLDDPVFLAPIRANLFRSHDDGEEWGLYWSRPSRRSEQA